MASWPTSRYPSSAEAYEQISERWSGRVIEAVKSNLVCVGAFDTTWKSELKLGDKVNIPVGSSLTAYAVDVTSDWAGGSNTNWGTSAESITIDKWYACPVFIDDGTMMQTQIKDLASRLGKRAGYEIAKTVDTDVNVLYTSLTSTWAGSDGQTFTDALLLELMEGLDEADVPRTERSLIGDPSMRKDMFEIDKFVNKDYNMTLTGEIGKTPYGDTILITNNLTAATTGAGGMYAHREAIGIVMQKMPTIKAYRHEPRYSTVVDATAIWGADVVRSTFGAYFYTRKS